MSQGSQELFPKSGLVLPLSKFSYATTHGESNAQTPWIHLAKPHHLSAIFENKWVEDGVNQGRVVRKFKVIQDPEVLEDIDIDILAIEANRAKTTGQNSKTNGKLPNVAVIVKNPCVAIRYPLQGDQVRRIQLRVTNVEDYYEILKILTRANVPFSEAPSTVSAPVQPPQHLARPFSSSSSLLRPCDSVSQIGCRPVSAVSAPDHIIKPGAPVHASWIAGQFQQPTSTSQTTHEALFQMPLHDSNQGFGMRSGQSSSVCTTSAPGLKPNETISSYFSNQSSSNNLLNVPNSTLGFVSDHTQINLYQPRPFTAPAASSQSLSQMLPPKRELPFKISRPTKKSKKEDAKSFKSVENPPVKNSRSIKEPLGLPDISTSHDRVAVENIDRTSATPAVIDSSMKRMRKLPSTISKERPKQNQSGKASAQNFNKDKGEDDAVPSIGQLFQEVPEELSISPETLSKLDTQALLSRAESTRLHEDPKPLTTPCSNDLLCTGSSTLSQTRKCRGCSLRKGKCDGKLPCDWCREFDKECTYTAPIELQDEVQVPSSQPKGNAEFPAKSTIAAPEAMKNSSMTENFLDLEVERTASKKLESSTHLPADIRSHTSSTNCNAGTTLTRSETSENAVQDLYLSHPARSVALAALQRSPGFSANDCQNLTDWASLSDAEQRRSLDTWICKQILNPAFGTLMKRMEENWRTNML